MKKILILLLLFCGFWANAQQYHDKGAKFEFATNEGDTITVNTRIPIIDEFGLINYYVDVADLLALNPAPVLEWGNITGTLSNQTDLQGALNDKADQSDLTAHTSNGNIHFTQSDISITESQVSDLKDYLRGDINDTNGANKLTLGSLEVTGQTILQNGLNMSSVPVGTSDNILTLNQSTGDVEQRVFSLGDIDIANAAGTNQFPVGLGDQLRFEGSGDTSISFDGVTNTINITSVPGSGGGGAVTTFNGRDGAVVSQAGDYSTAMVNENTNLYFTEPRVRATDLAGLTIANTPISSTNTFLQALGRLQGQINDREPAFSKNTAFNKNFGTSAGTVAQGNDSRINNGQTAYSWGNHASAGYVPTSRTITAGLHLSGGGNLSANRTITFTPTTDTWIVDDEGNQRMYFGDPSTEYAALFRASSAIQGFQFRDVDNNVVATIRSNGSANFNRFVEAASFRSNDYINGFSLDRSSSTLSRWRNNGSGTTVISGDGVIIIRPNGDADTAGQITINPTGNTFFDGNLNASNLSGTNTGDQTLSGLGGVPTTRSILAGEHLTGGGNLSSNVTLNYRPTVGLWAKDSQGVDRMYFADNTNVTNGIILKASNAGQQLQYRDENNSIVFRVNTQGTGVFEGGLIAGNLGVTSTTKASGRFYAGSANPSNTTRLNYDGHLFVSELTSIGDVTANSDRRLKKNIKRIDNALAIVQLLGGYEYDRKDIDLHQAGVIAQEVEEVFPVAVSEDEKGIKSVAYNQLIALLIEAVKEQQIEIEQLKTLINEK